MTDRHLHIITHDVPWPADYGGVIDLFYKLKALHAQGVKIHLHCFTQGRPHQEELNKYCCTVNYYRRKNNIGRLSLTIPFIVNSRNDIELLRNLQKDNYPVLLEGIHCTYLLHKRKLGNRKVIVRLHNAEFEYYRKLAKLENNILKKTYFRIESQLLKRYERSLADKAVFLSVSRHDMMLYRNAFKSVNIHYLPVFLPYKFAIGKEGKGCFCLYHGNLSVNENEKVATWLLENVFNDLAIPFVIAGKDPSIRLQELAHKMQHTCLVSNPTDKELDDMIQKAHIHVLPSFNNTGIKLKLLNAAFNGRHCLVNQAAIEGSGLDAICYLAEDKTDFKRKIKELYQQPFTEQESQQRQGLLQTLYNNDSNARELMTFLW